MSRRLHILPEAADILRRQPSDRKRRFRAALRLLRDDPTGTSVGLDVRVLDTDEHLPKILRLRLGDWRVAFVVEPDTVLVLHVFHRGDGYDWLEDLGY